MRAIGSTVGLHDGKYQTPTKKGKGAQDNVDI